jgi:hypothetical protein
VRFLPAYGHPNDFDLILAGNTAKFMKGRSKDYNLMSVLVKSGC